MVPDVQVKIPRTHRSMAAALQNSRGHDPHYNSQVTFIKYQRSSVTELDVIGKASECEHESHVGISQLGAWVLMLIITIVRCSLCLSPKLQNRVIVLFHTYAGRTKEECMQST